MRSSRERERQTNRQAQAGRQKDRRGGVKRGEGERKAVEFLIVHFVLTSGLAMLLQNKHPRICK